ncbi:MAG: flagellar hook-basal body complex protein [Eubacterium sp.]|nr:flagellar hook-basal body complex protein [Eubacterium sp.]
MMRSLFSGISGLKVHQTRMDVIGNNISNVNTVGFRASTVNFTDVFYQTSQGASGPNAETGAPGTNATQIGLGANVAAIAVDLSGTGATQRTDRGMDVMINGDAFLIAKQNGNTYFTKSGALDIDANGTLYCTTNGAAILGWPAVDDGNGNREIRKDTATTLQLMGGENAYSAPNSTKDITLKGNIDQNDTQVNFLSADQSTGYPISVSFYDKLGGLNTAKFVIHKASATDDSLYTLKLTDILDSDGASLLRYKDESGKWWSTADSAGPLKDANKMTIKINNDTELGYTVSPTGEITITGEMPHVKFNGSTGEFEWAGKDASSSAKTDTLAAQTAIRIGLTKAGESPFEQVAPYSGSGTAPRDGLQGGVAIDFKNLTMYAQDGVSNVKPTRGKEDGTGTGNAAGSLNGFSIQTDGKIFGVYSNGDKNLLGQVAVATFANPSGLEAAGNSLFAATKNSGDFDGVGIDISEVGKFSVGALEMSDVDLANEFTTMITTQRGFQANSRVITTSDSMLEELVNLKR